MLLGSRHLARPGAAFSLSTCPRELQADQGWDEQAARSAAPEPAALCVASRLLTHSECEAETEKQATLPVGSAAPSPQPASVQRHTAQAPARGTCEPQEASGARNVPLSD